MTDPVVSRLTIDVTQQRGSSSSLLPSPYSSPVSISPEILSVLTSQTALAPQSPRRNDTPSDGAVVHAASSAALARQASKSLLQSIHKRVDESIDSFKLVMQKEKTKPELSKDASSSREPVPPGTPGASRYRTDSTGPEINALLSDGDTTDIELGESSRNDSNDVKIHLPLRSSIDQLRTIDTHPVSRISSTSNVFRAYGTAIGGSGGEDTTSTSEQRNSSLDIVDDIRVQNGGTISSFEGREHGEIEQDRREVRFATGQTRVRHFTSAPAYDGEDPISIPNSAALSVRLGGRRGSGMGLGDALGDCENSSSEECAKSNLSVKNSRGLLLRCLSACGIYKSIVLARGHLQRFQGKMKSWFFGLPMMIRMILIVIIPVIGAIALSAIGLSASISQQQHDIEIQEQLSFHRAANHLMHHLQHEKTWLRYCWYESSPEAIAGRDEEMNITSEERTTFLNFLNVWKLQASSRTVRFITDSEAYSTLIQSLSGLERHRHLVLKKLIPLSEVSSLYQNAINSIITLASGSLDQVDDLDLSNSLSGFLDIALLDNSVDQELDFIGVSFLSGEFGSLESIGEANRLAGIMESAWSGFQDTAAYELHAKPFFTTPEVTASLATMRRLRQQILTYSPTLGTGSANISSIRYEDFVAASSSFLDAVDESSENLIESIDGTAAELKASSEAGVTPVAVIVGVVVVLSVILVWLLILSIQSTDRVLFDEAARRKTTETAIWRFFPQEFMTLLNHSDIMSVQCGDRRVLGDSTTIIVADLRGFTTASEQLGPDSTYDWLMEYVKVVGTVIQSHGGFIEKTLGDGIVAMFTDPQLALKAAIEMQIAVQQTNLSRGFHTPWPYNVGIGVHSGEVVLGILGDSHRLMGSIVSDTVAIANKVEGLTKSYGAKILISGSTLRQCDMSEIGHRLVGSVRVTGDSTELLELYEVYEADERSMAEFKDETREEFEKAVKLFRMRNFDESTEILEDLQSRIPRSSDGGVDRRVHLVGSAVRDGLSQNWIGED